MKVYIVTKSWSDVIPHMDYFEIVGTYRTRENAERVATELSDDFFCLEIVESELISEGAEL